MKFFFFNLKLLSNIIFTNSKLKSQFYSNKFIMSYLLYFSSFFLKTTYISIILIVGYENKFKIY